MPTRVKVLDFGISKIRGSQSLRTQDAILMGTPQYMSPEQATGKNTTVDARTDVFALGAIVYEMLGGQPAFAGGSLAEVVYRVVHGAADAPARARPGPSGQRARGGRARAAEGPAARPQDVGAFVLELTGRPLHSFHTGQPRGVDSALGQPLDPTHTPRPTGPTTSWPQDARLGSRAGSLRVRSPSPAGPRARAPTHVALPRAGRGRLRRGGRSGRALELEAEGARPTPATAGLGATRAAEAPRAAAAPPSLRRSPPGPAPATVGDPCDEGAGRTPRRTRGRGPGRGRCEKPPVRRPHPSSGEGDRAGAARRASAEPAKAVVPEPPAAPASARRHEARGAQAARPGRGCARRGTSRSRLPGWWTRASSSRRRRSGTPSRPARRASGRTWARARAAFRNISDAQLKQIVLRACVRNQVWLF